MPNDQATNDDELQLEVTSEDESVEDTQDSDNAEGESEDTQVQFEEEPQTDKLSPAEENAKRQEEAWLGKIISGKAEVSDAPKWLQGRLDSRLEATNKIPETEDVIRKVLEKEREDDKFKELQTKIPKLSPAQAKELNERYKTLRPAGKVVALQNALDAMGLSEKVREAEMRGITKGKMSLPVSGQLPVRKSEQAVGGVPLDVVHDDKKWNEMVRRGSNPEA